MGIRDWFSQKPPVNLPVPTFQAPLDINQAIEMVLVNSVKSQAETAAIVGKAVTEQLLGLSEIQQALFTRRRIRNGGIKRAADGKRGKNGRFAKESGCRLCANPTVTNPTVEEIYAHAKHESANQYVNESDFQTRADGVEVVECEDCVKGTPGHSHQVH